MTSVADLFGRAGVPYVGVVRWGQSVPLSEPGVYVVATNKDPADDQGLPECPVDRAAVEELLLARPEAAVDGIAATPDMLIDRLIAMWPSNEPAIYIGLAGTSTQNRVDQFYRTRLGARAPHAGGWPVKMLKSDDLWVHFGPTSDPARAESEMVELFASNLPGHTSRALIDPCAPLPFANLTYPAGRRKKHGLRGMKAPHTVTAGGLSVHSSDAAPVAAAMPADLVAPRGAGLIAPEAAGLVRYTQNVTPSDISSGQLRVPRADKSVFPVDKALIEIELDGHRLTASWDPRTTGDEERSGIIRVGRGTLTNYVAHGDPRRIETTATGYRIL